MRLAALVVTLFTVLGVHAAGPRPSTEAFAREVDLRLDVPPEVQTEYARRLEAALARAGLDDRKSQYFMLVDRSAHVQAAFIYWRSPEGAWQLIGASPVATGRPGEYEHFLTSLLRSASSRIPSRIPISAPRARATRSAFHRPYADSRLGLSLGTIDGQALECFARCKRGSRRCRAFDPGQRSIPAFGVQ